MNGRIQIPIISHLNTGIATKQIDKRIYFAGKQKNKSLLGLVTIKHINLIHTTISLNKIVGTIKNTFRQERAFWNLNNPFLIVRYKIHWCIYMRCVYMGFLPYREKTIELLCPAVMFCPTQWRSQLLRTWVNGWNIMLILFYFIFIIIKINYILY